MRQLKQNLFWVGVALAALSLVVLYVVVVVPQYARKAKLQNSIAGKGGILSKLDGPVPGDPDIEAWNAFKERLKKEYAEIVGFYEACDSHLERWFEGLPEEPGRDAFMARYRDEAQNIEKKLQEKGVKFGIEVEDERKEKARGGFNWEEPSLDDWDKINQVPGDLLRALKTIQKRFWLRQRVADVALEGNVRISRVVDFRFLRRLNERIQNALWETVPMGTPVTPFPPNTPEFELPEGLGRTITFRFGVELPFSEVPRFIQEFLNPAAQTGPRQRLLLNLPMVHVTLRSQNPSEITITYEEGNLEQKRQELEKVKPQIATRDVLLVLTCQVLDFDPSKARAFGRPRP